MTDENQEEFNSSEDLGETLDLSSDEITSEASTEEVSAAEVKQEAPLEKARKNGYLTREEYIAKHGSDKGFKSPEQFNEFGDKYDEVKDILTGLKSKLEKREKEQEALVQYIANVRERERAKAKQELQLALQQAKEEGDIEAVTNITREQLKQEYEEQQSTKSYGQDDAVRALNAFQERNRHWYNEQNPELIQRAQELDQEIRSGYFAMKHGIPMPVTYDQLAQQIETAMKAEYPDLVGKPTRKPAPVLSSAKSSVNKSADAISAVGSANKVFNSLSDDLKAVYNVTKRIVEKTGHKYTPEDFIRKLKEDGEI